jgi:transposase-like protein
VSFSDAFKARVDEEIADGYKLSEIAKRLATHAHSIREWSTGTGTPRKVSHIAIARFMRTTPEKLQTLIAEGKIIRAGSRGGS